MARMSHHGGGCCGARHLWGFIGDETVDDIKGLVGTGSRQGSVRSMNVEAIITNRQCRYHPSLPINLQKAGFRLVSRFNNPNTGNICNVFHYTKNVKPLNRLAFPIVEAEE